MRANIFPMNASHVQTKHQKQQFTFKFFKKSNLLVLSFCSAGVWDEAPMIHCNQKSIWRLYWRIFESWAPKMFPWKNVCTILPKGIPLRVIILRQSSSALLVFRKQDLIKYGVGREDMFTCSSAFPRPRLRFFSAKSSQDKKESSVFQELVESQEQPQTQLTVGAKG